MQNSHCYDICCDSRLLYRFISYFSIQINWLLCLLHFRGLAFPTQLSLSSVEEASSSLSNCVWCCLCLHSQQTHTIHTTPMHAHFDCMFYRTEGFYLEEWRKINGACPLKTIHSCTVS